MSVAIAVMNSPKKYVCIRTHVIRLFYKGGSLNKISGSNNNNDNDKYDIYIYI